MRRITAIAATLAVCLIAIVTRPAPADAQSGKFQEAPALAEQVKAGKLPPAEQRLPEQPLVVPVVEKVGEYGGVWRRAFLGPADANNYVRVVYDGLFRFTPDGAEIEPKIAVGAKSSGDFKVWTILLRKGARWSDGAPFTADDIVFWYKDVLLNKDLMPSLPSWIRNADGTAANVEKVDDYTVRFTYDRPATLFLTEVANQDGADGSYAMFLPAHYLKKFHPAYTAKEDLDRLAQEVSFKTWTELFLSRATLYQNPERPTMAAWMPVSRVSDPVFMLRRNPYYIGVDTAGNQLPYIDEVRFTYFADQQALNLAAIAGNFDMQARHIQMTNYPVLKEQEKNGKYRVLTWPTFGGADAVINFNMTYNADPEIGKLIRTKDFRVALSIAINRDEIKESVFLGLGEARQGVPAPWHPYFPGKEWATKHTEFNRDEANKVLDALGLTKRDAQGIRLMVNGKPATIELSVVPAFGAWPDVAQLVARDWEAVGIKTVVQIRERALHFKMNDANELMASIWNEDTTAFPFTGNAKFDPRNTPILTLGPLYTRWLTSGGKEGVEPIEPIKRIMQLVDTARTVGRDGQIQAAQELFRIWADNVFEIGTIGLTPMVQGVVVVNSKLHNVPTTIGNDWPLRTPGNTRTEQYFFATK
ncbi:MAG TPA: ABC transporter substrate-binding protein [Acetobacteraceae bacterium]|jgi:peptide/nickel transport system substrate-binding protein|nr:ABC transporter substrate-binding protein [Acetobacteraceae bacterium]